MGLLDKLQEPALKERSCAVRRIVDSLQGEERSALHAALTHIRTRQPGYTASWLMKVLASEGITISDMSIYRHVNGRCSCGAE